MTQFYQSVIFLAYNIAHDWHSEMFTELYSSILYTHTHTHTHTYICFKIYVYLAALGLSCAHEIFNLMQRAGSIVAACGI